MKSEIALPYRITSTTFNSGVCLYKELGYKPYPNPKEIPETYRLSGWMNFITDMYRKTTNFMSYQKMTETEWNMFLTTENQYYSRIINYLSLWISASASNGKQKFTEEMYNELDSTFIEFEKFNTNLELKYSGEEELTDWSDYPFLHILNE